MGSSTEEIEAKLAAFVDGELDAAGREDIEKHLLANPQHRKLLDDLMRGRELLCDLPRESAPAEILDSIQGHLERRLLLDEESAAGAGRSGAGGWQRFMAVAAVLMLTATLGLVIYSVLPNAKSGSDLTAALDRPESAAPIDVMPAPTETRVARSELQPGDAASPSTEADLRDRAVAAATDAIRDGAGGPAGGELAAGALRRAEPDLSHPVIPGAALAIATWGGAAAAPVIVLASDDRAATERELSTVLLDNRVMYEQVASAGSRRLADAGSREEPGESIFVAKKLTRAQFQAIDQALAAPARARKQQVAQETQQQYQAFRQDVAPAAANAKDDMSAVDADKSGFDAALAKVDAAKGKATESAATAGVDAMPQEAKDNTGVNLGVNLGASAGNVAASQPVEVIASGDKLKIELPGMTQNNVAGAQTVEVAADGSIQIAPLEPMTVAGLTTDEVQQKLAGMFGEGKAGPAGAIVVEKQAVQQEAGAKELAENEPEPLTDVVIVVRSSTFDDTRRADAPATQPVAEAEFPSAPSTAPAVAQPGATAEPSRVSPSTIPSTQPGN